MKTILVCLVLSSVSWASDDLACVRNYLTGGFNTCEQGSKDWAYLYNADPHAKFETCTRRQPDGYCDLSPDFVRVKSKPNNETVCVTRYDNNLVDLCQNYPDQTDKSAFVVKKPEFLI